MAVLKFVKVIMLSAATTYPFAFLIQNVSNIQAKSFVPCNDQVCVSFQLFANPLGRLSWLGAFSESAVLHGRNPFLFIQNGNELGSKTQSAQQMPSPLCGFKSARDMQKVCELDETRSRILNPLRDSGVALLVYEFGICGWFVFKVIHDWCLLLGIREFLTLQVGMSSMLFQMFAVCSGFWWSKVASDVFVAPLSQDSCACYYQMPELASMLALASPYVLLLALLQKVEKMCRAIAFGDYLHTQRYDLPYHVAAASNSDAMRSLLNGRIYGNQHAVERSGPTTEEFRWLGLIWRVQRVLRWVTVGIVGIASCPIIVRLMTLMIRNVRQNHLSLPTLICLSAGACGATLLLAFFPAQALAKTTLHHIRMGRTPKWLCFRSLAIYVLWTVFSTLVSVASCYVICSPMVNCLLFGSSELSPEACLRWAASGIWLLVHNALTYFQLEVMKPLQQVLFLRAREMLGPREVVELAETYPDFALDKEKQQALDFMSYHPAFVSEADETSTWLQQWPAIADGHCMPNKYASVAGQLQLDAQI